MKIAVLATGVGNVRSVLRAIERAAAGLCPTITPTADPSVVRDADVLVVPGQGSFGAFAEAIDARGLRGPILEKIEAGTPYLGICLGLQILFEESDESPGAKGLGVLEGRVWRLAPGLGPDGRPRALPHMGWNRVVPVHAGAIVAEDHYYFAHSYAARPSDPSVTIASTEYGDAITSAVTRGRVVGVQFHPEKSQRAGLAVVTRFLAGAASAMAA